MLNEGITEILEETLRGKNLKKILKEMSLNEILKSQGIPLKKRGEEIIYQFNPDFSLYNNPNETGIRFKKRFAEGGITSAIGKIQNRKDGSDAMGEGGIGNLLVGEGGLLFDTNSPKTMAADAGILALTAFPPAAIAARLIQAGYKGAKLTKAMNEIKKLQEALPKTGLGLKGSGRGSTFMQLTVPKEVAGVVNMADGGAAEKEEEKTSDMKKLIDDVKVLLNTEIVNKRGGAAKQKVEEEKKTSKMKGRVTDKSVANRGKVVTQIEEEKLNDDKLLNDSDKLLNDSVEEEVKGRFDFLKNMDPALARALIAGGSAALRPTEGPVRSFLSLGEFGGAFADSLSKSDAAKTDIERLYATVVAQTPEGEEPPTVREFLLSQKEGSSDLTFAELSQSIPAILASLQTKFGKDDVELSDFAVQRGQDEDGEDIFVPLNIAIEDVRTDDDIRKLIKDSVLNPNAKQETGRTFFR